MRLTHASWKEGRISITPEHADDLWHLELLIEPGDQVRARTERKIKIGDPSADRSIKVIKKHVTLTLEAQKTEHTGTNLRISGTILEAPEDLPRGSHHSITITPGDELTLQKKEWPRFQRERLEEALRKKAQTYLLVLFDREEALFATLSATGTRIIAREQGDVAKKAETEHHKTDFYKHLANLTENLANTHAAERIILASPQFWSAYLRNALPPHLKNTSVSVTCSAVSESAIPEILKRPELGALLIDERARTEELITERLLEALAKDKAGYGLEDVQNLVTQGNVQMLAVSETTIRSKREHGTYTELETLLRQAESLGADIHILTTPSAARKIDSLGGIACIQRW
ncbi:MAG: mRNA surveillance protein pelota [Nitrosarchaeum sp.]|nr:mRNA surveillance protein pelota [Nitrosarchaeum sp.]